MLKSLLIFAPVLIILSDVSTQAQERSLFVPISPEAMADADMPPVDSDFDATLGYVTLDKELLEEGLIGPEERGDQPQPIPITLPDGQSVLLATEDIETKIDPATGAETLLKWTGSVQGEPLSRLVFVGQADGKLIGNITIRDRVYEYRSQSGESDQYAVTEPVGSGPLRDAPLEIPAAQDTVVESLVSSPDFPPNYLAEVDLLVVYTQRAKEVQNSIEGLISLAVEDTNVSFKKQEIPVHLNLIHTEEVVYPDGNGIVLSNDTLEVDGDLEKIIARDDGVLDEVHEMREQYKADLVSVWIKGKPNTPCGNATVLVEENDRFADTAFSIVNAECAMRYNSFAHELGHNLGAAHEFPNVIGRFPFSHRFVGPNVRTVDATNGNCNGCFRASVWSDSSYGLYGLEWGAANVADNKMTFIQTAPFVASLSDRMTPLASVVSTDLPIASLGEAIQVAAAAADEPALPDGGVQTPAEPVVDVLVLHIPDPQNPSEDVSDEIAEEFARTNESFARSGIHAAVRVAGATEARAPAGLVDMTGMSDLLRALQDTHDGWLDEVENLRKSTGADLVTLWVPGTEKLIECGIANMYTGNPSSAFSVVNQRCLENWSFQHSIGHNFGARHEIAADPSMQPFPQGHGYVNLTEGWTDIMSYGVECLRKDAKRCERRGVWSGGATGSTELGADNASVLNFTAPTVARYSEQLGQVTGFGGP